MNPLRKALIAGTGLLLAGFVGYGIYNWVRVIESIPYSTNCATTLAQISHQNALLRPFFIGTVVVGLVLFEFIRRQFSRKLRTVFIVLLGLGAALILAPWLVDSFSRLKQLLDF